MDKYNLYKSGMRFLEVYPVNIKVKTGFIVIPIQRPSWDLTLDFGEIAMLIFCRLRALKLNS